LPGEKAQNSVALRLQVREKKAVLLTRPEDIRPRPRPRPQVIRPRPRLLVIKPIHATEPMDDSMTKNHLTKTTKADKSSRKARLALLAVHSCFNCVSTSCQYLKSELLHLRKTKHLKQAVSHPSTVW